MLDAKLSPFLMLISLAMAASFASVVSSMWLSVALCSGHSWDGKNVLLALYMILSQKGILPARVGFKNLRRRKIDDPEVIKVLLPGYMFKFPVQILKHPP